MTVLVLPALSVPVTASYATLLGQVAYGVEELPREGREVTAGGRVLGVTALGRELAAARAQSILRMADGRVIDPEEAS